MEEVMDIDRLAQFAHAAGFHQAGQPDGYGLSAEDVLQYYRENEKEISKAKKNWSALYKIVKKNFGI